MPVLVVLVLVEGVLVLVLGMLVLGMLVLVVVVEGRWGVGGGSLTPRSNFPQTAPTQLIRS